ncbi:MAG TPA: PAS domain S-box protein [Candidatus Eisenbacteria bacterium]|jgi:hypothetical protein
MRTPLRVLLIEDSEADAERLLHELRGGGFDPVSERAPTAEAMRSSLAKPWDVILAEYRLPDFDAITALEILTQSGRDLPLIIVSSHIGEEAAVAAMHAGARDYVTKENLSRLVPAVRREVREASGRRARRQAEQALRESEERYRSLIEHTSDLITLSTVDGTILFQSASVERILGHRPEQVIGRNWAEFVHPEDAPALRQAIRDVVGGSGFASSEVRVRHRDGSWRVLEVRSTLKTSRRGLTLVLGATRDITDRKRLEDRLRESEKMEAVGRLADGLAHDFSDLLTAIMGYGELLWDQTGDRPQLRENVEQISKAAARAAELTRQLLALGRRQVLTPQVLDLNTVISRMEEVLRQLIGDPIRLVVRPGQGVAPVQADLGQIEQVIVNLAVYARDAMASGGTLTLGTADFEARPGGSGGLPPGPYVLLTVEDTGGGIDPEIRSHLFEPFFAAHRPGRGSGLGLSTVYAVVSRSGGHLQVDSVPGRGTRFRVYLPRASAQPSPVASVPAPSPGEPPRGDETILLVEGEEAVRSLARRVLTDRGYTVLEARDGREAQETIERHPTPVHLVVTAEAMPGPHGRELAGVEGAPHGATKILYLSGSGDAGMTAARESGARFLQKPFTAEMLTRMVHEALADEPSPAAVASPAAPGIG